MKLLLCAIAGYLLGSISVSILVTKYIFHDDLRQQGSGNAGATNAARVYGLGAGVLTFAGDFAKSILAMLLGRGLGGMMGLAVGGAACLLGHCFPVYFKFKGGKAVSAGAAVGLMIDWRLFVILVAVFALMALLSKRASVCSMACAVVLAAGTPLFTKEPMLIALAVFTGLLVLVMHRANIRRLLRGEEPPFHLGSRKK